ncbi:MAG: Rpn family recombination-promoting nuclease/putative transposase [Polyangiaceae bacterium]
MERPTFADPKTDFAFKRIFGSEQHKDVLVAFLNDMLDLDEAHRIVEVELLPPEQRPPVAELKLSIVDVKCTDARGVTYVVEMQVLQVEGFEKRVVYNVAKAYVSQIARGELYPALNDVVGITICDFELWPDNGERRIPMLSRWRMTEEETGARGELGQIRLVFLELPKYDASRPPETVVEKWAYFFREADNLTVVPEVLAEHPFVDALEAARTAGFTAAEWDAYILAGIALQNERGALSVAEKRGEARGEERGRQQGLKDGREQGLKDGREQTLRFAIKGMCSLLAMNLTPEQTDHLDKLDADGLTALFAHLQERKAWP